MNTQLNCPACGNAIQVADAQLGKPARCPHCRERIVAHADGTAEAILAPVPVRPLTRSGDKSADIASGIVRGAIWLIGLILVIAVVVSVLSSLIASWMS
jgi:DNA-directed RNA polymerase subunit RPC12/RpoP